MQVPTYVASVNQTPLEEYMVPNFHWVFGRFRKVPIILWRPEEVESLQELDCRIVVELSAYKWSGCRLYH